MSCSMRATHRRGECLVAQPACAADPVPGSHQWTGKCLTLDRAPPTAFHPQK
ncbi:hypothetical protein [Streptomyces sp. NPDC029721]|uniref:hypothetical protein n=1 Tax=Streptomyces sp. NPDC029721 TaxID=3157090 RepID=UPI0033FF2A02